MVWLWVWGIITAINLVVEFLVSKLFTIWFSAGGMVTLLVVALVPNISLIWQFIIFAGVSVALLICVRKLCVKLLDNSQTATNQTRK